MKHQITVLPKNKIIFADEGALLLDVLRQNGFYLPAACGGNYSKFRNSKADRNRNRLVLRDWWWHSQYGNGRKISFYRYRQSNTWN